MLLSLTISVVLIQQIGKIFLAQEVDDLDLCQYFSVKL
jgi:hypothetical protein